MTYKNTYQLNTSILLTQNKYEYQHPDWEDQLTSINNTKVTYDEIGNPLSIGNNITLSWINGRQLKEYQDQETTITYQYNHNSIRTSKKVNNIETKYYLEGNKIILEKQGENVLYYIRNSIDDLIGFTYNDTIYYYIKNMQNDIIGILDNNYNQIATYKYDAYGNILSITDQNESNIKDNPSHIANINPFRYRSYYYDKETNLYYLNSRYYNPEWGRFLNIDELLSTGQSILGLNMYLYTDNNPITYTDVEGKFAIAIIGTIIGITAGTAHAVKKMVEHHETKGHIGFFDWMQCVSEGAQVASGIAGIGMLGQELYNSVSSSYSMYKASQTPMPAKTGWQLGDDITTPTKQGNYPSWSTARARYWKNEAFYNTAQYESSDVIRMQRGNAPLIQYKKNLLMYPMELHHLQGRSIPNPHAKSNLLPVTPWEHANIDPHRHFNP